jgi:dihydrofolate synthase/folylpolyglutamate synthase
LERSLSEWLDYQQRVHPRDIELGLDRVRDVWNRMGAPSSAPVVITVGGTNGKGSTVAFLEAMLSASGRRVGCYTSPHLLRYNERVRVLGADVDDELLIAAFERIESARQEIPLTYFEFGTLAALWIFAQSKLDVAVLEVGLGGRLDAVNIIDADAAIVTTVDLDHQDWLGNNVDTIGREKAGIFRPGRPAIIGMRDPPRGLLDEAARLQANVLCADVDFRVERGEKSWRWQCHDVSLDLPYPTLSAPVQLDNAASSIAVLYCLRKKIAWNPTALADGVRSAQAAARLQRFSKAGEAELIVDVGHNPQAARELARWLRELPPRKNVAVFGALSDKDVAGIVAPLSGHIGRWYVGSLDADSPRGLSAANVAAKMAGIIDPALTETHSDIANALDAASARGGDRIVVFGSFFVAAAAFEWAKRLGYGPASGQGQV